MKGPRGQREGELDPEAVAALRVFRVADDMPGPAQARVWARLAEATAEPEGWPQAHVRKGRSEWAWAAVVVAAAAALLLASRAGVLGPLVGIRGGEAASYAEGAGPATATAAAGAERTGSAGAAEGVSQDMAEETAVSGDMVMESAGASEPRASGAEARGRGGAGHAGAKAGGEASQAGKAGGAAGQAGAKTSGEASHAGGNSGAGAGAAADEASGLAQEAELLARAQAAIQGGRAEEALARLAEYGRRFPGGTLREEHDALRALALCAAGRVIEGRGEARAFLASHGGSALAERVRRGCLGE